MGESISLFQIAIDGPSGSGKSTLAKNVSKELNILYLDTGAMYRACGLKALREGISPKEKDEVSRVMEMLDLTIRFEDDRQKVFLGKEDVSAEIRKTDVSVAASDISTFPEVRMKMVEMQREIAKGQSVVMDGRDVGSYILPNAKYKFFLIADSKERAARRLAELQAKGIRNQIFDEVLADIEYRDKQDSTRSFAPLTKMPDAVEIDTTHNAPEDTLRQLLAHLPGDLKGMKE